MSARFVAQALIPVALCQALPARTLRFPLYGWCWQVHNIPRTLLRSEVATESVFPHYPSISS